MIYVIRNNIGGKYDFQRSCNAGIWWIDNTQGFAINGLTTLFLSMSSVVLFQSKWIFTNYFRNKINLYFEITIGVHVHVKFQC